LLFAHDKLYSLPLRTCFDLMDSSVYMESTTIKFEWTVNGLAELFESRYVHGYGIYSLASAVSL
jgi:hypothetical protein